ncbi:MAG: hypothetical protein IJB69_03390 [Clostridia bacterium]|nr:hypothetical protein [Clostridia bacterium]
MADILGAAAGCGMMVLIMMLIFSFLVQIGVMKKETMAAAGRVFGRCGLFALGIDAAILLIAWVALGWEDVQSMKGLLCHGMFGWLSETAVPVHTFLQVQYMVMALSGLLCYAAFRKNGDEKSAMRGLNLFYLLPGMGIFFLPVSVGFIPLLIAGVLFAFSKYIPAGKLFEKDSGMYILYTGLLFMLVLVLYKLVSGV